MSQNLSLACKHMVETMALDELEEMVERDAFEIWKTLQPGKDETFRQRHQGAVELLTTIRNIASG